MKVSREQVDENRKRILDAAAKLFRERGFDDVTVAEIMKAAGLTHGAFYGHFKSKEELVAQACGHALAVASESGNYPKDLHGFATVYLSQAHRDDPGSGCVFSALGSEAVRASKETRDVLTDYVRTQIENFSKSAPGSTTDERRQAAVCSWAAMIGALVLARVVDDPVLSDQILADARARLGRDQVSP